MDGKKGNAKYSYVAQLGYDKFEQRVFLEYGNGTKTNYTYEPERRRLQNMTAATAAQRNSVRRPKDRSGGVVPTTSTVVPSSAISVR